MSVHAFEDFLVRTGRLESGARERAHAALGDSGAAAETVLGKLGLISERDLAEGFADFLGLARVSPGEVPERPVAIEGINPAFLRERKVVPLTRGRSLRVAMAMPGDDFAVRALEFASALPVERAVATAGEIDDALRRLYPSAGDTALPARGPHKDDADRLRELAGDAPVISFVNRMIADAFECGASDIHLGACGHGLDIRFRIDGLLRARPPAPPDMAAAIASRLKVMASLDIAERRLPQDGRIRFTVRGREIDLRVATSPSAFGESLVLRLLDRRHLPADFAGLGLRDRLAEALRALLARPEGIVLVTGPTGSGKTTTLYTALAGLNRPERKILTAEDPVEYEIERVTQLQVVPKIGLTFAAAIRSFLRQDPDIIMVGEVRDRETAEAAIQAALTGHLVLSTLHTNSAAAALPRLLDMGVEDYLLAATLSGVMAQRLARRLCAQCREEVAAPPALADRIAALTGISPDRLWHGPGCAACSDSGYRGRLAIAELIEVTPTIRSLLRAGVTGDEIEAAARAEGFRPLVVDGLERALAGETTVEEVFRVTRDG